MMLSATLKPATTRTVRVLDHAALADALPRLEAYLLRDGPLVPLSRHPAWLNVLARGLRHTPYCVEVAEGDQTCGFLALADVRSLLFGRYLVSLPYLNYGGPVADDPAVARLLIDRAARLADDLGVRYLELRNEHAAPHPQMKPTRAGKGPIRL